VPSFKTGTVSSILSERVGLQRVEVDGERAYVLTRLIGPVAVGDTVVVNTTAVDLGLGSGGWHVVHWNLARDTWTAPGHGHILKLRYTSLQADTGVAEEAPGFAPPPSLEGMPVVACALHSQVPCVAAVFKHLQPDKRLVYVMTDAAALPLDLSDLVAAMRANGMLDATVTAGQAFGGDYEAVNLPSALDVARAVARADAVVVATGPGVVGTGTKHGFSALEVAAIVDAAAAGRATPIVALRYSDADPRERHRGVSHHSTTALGYANHQPVVPVPDTEPAPAAIGAAATLVVTPNVPDLLAAAGLHVTSMGRGPADDPKFYAYAGAAGAAAAGLVA
jgi:hypothetical protein